jgi:2-polyprenyl-3-methyl-5-hydroxy-6-metoxy-1,4-benzoquinol methylase
VTCFLCGSTDYRERNGSVRDNDTLKILECNHCGLVFLSNLEHINEDYYQESNMSEGFSVQQWLNETHTDDTRRFEFVKEMIINKDIIDFGSGAGGFLSQAKKIAKSVTGIELDNKIISHYKNEDILHTADIESLADNHYDLITAFHVIEHLKEPREILDALISKLKKNGKLILEVPNANDALLSLYKNEAFSHFTYWSPHLFLYTDHTLRLLFKPFNIEIDFIKHIQRYPLSNHLYWLSHNKPGGHQVWGNFIDSPELTKAYESQLASFNATDTILLQLRKR